MKTSVYTLLPSKIYRSSYHNKWIVTLRGFPKLLLSLDTQGQGAELLKKSAGY
jgi:hypothetical protein